MKEIVHTGKWHEPIVIVLKQGILSEHHNLLVDACIVCKDEQISPELLTLERKGYVTIRQLTPPVAPSILKEVDMTPEEIARLEEELLNEDGRGAVSNQEE